MLVRGHKPAGHEPHGCAGPAFDDRGDAGRGNGRDGPPGPLVSRGRHAGPGALDADGVSSAYDRLQLAREREQAAPANRGPSNGGRGRRHHGGPQIPRTFFAGGASTGRRLKAPVDRDSVRSAVRANHGRASPRRDDRAVRDHRTLGTNSPRINAGGYAQCDARRSRAGTQFAHRTLYHVRRSRRKTACICHA